MNSQKELFYYFYFTYFFTYSIRKSFYFIQPDYYLQQCCIIYLHFFVPLSLQKTRIQEIEEKRKLREKKGKKAYNKWLRLAKENIYISKVRHFFNLL